jgi:hypothetical protein
MDQGEYSRPNRTEQLWRALCALFGVDSVKRRFGLQAPAEWSAALSHLTDAQLRNGVDKLTRSGAEHVPSLPQFLSMCHQAREFEDHSPLPRITGPTFSKWEIEGNQHLYAFVMRQTLGLHRHFDEADTRILLEHKRAWVEDREVDDIGAGVPVEQQKRAWNEVMAAALSRIEKRAQEAV